MHRPLPLLTFIVTHRVEYYAILSYSKYRAFHFFSPPVYPKPHIQAVGYRYF